MGPLFAAVAQGCKAGLHLEAGKLCRDEGNETGATEHLQSAGRLIEETKYGRKKRLINNSKWLMDNE